MNVNEECLLTFLTDPSRLDKSIEILTEYMLILRNNILSGESQEIKLKIADV